MARISRMGEGATASSVKSVLLSKKVFAACTNYCREGTQRTQRQAFPSLRSLRSFAAIIFGCGVRRAVSIRGFDGFQDFARFARFARLALTLPRAVVYRRSRAQRLYARLAGLGAGSGFSKPGSEFRVRCRGSEFRVSGSGFDAGPEQPGTRNPELGTFPAEGSRLRCQD